MYLPLVFINLTRAGGSFFGLWLQVNELWFRN